MEKKMKKVLLAIEITVDEENISELYPNYRINWGTTEEFIEHLTDDMETKVDLDGKFIDHLKTYGYSTRVLSRDEYKSLT